MANDLNFRAHFGSSPAPFKIDVSPDFIKETTLKVSLTRLIVDVDVPEWSEGPSRHNVSTLRNYWLNGYDWFKIQDQLNKKYTQFTTTVTTGPKSNFSDPVPLHFVHHKSPRKDAIPLLFSHGWPGSFMEVGHIIDGLTDPPNASDPAFHVVVPSIPGFGFSPAPKKLGLGNKEVANVLNSLMLQLGYNKYVMQGGDFGGLILRYLAAAYPENVVSVLSNFYIVTPNETDWKRFHAGETSEEENFGIRKFENYKVNSSGYRFIQQTRPASLAIGMTDSPIGNAMWMYDLMHAAVDFHQWTPEEIVTWSMMYYIQGPYAGMRYYKEGQSEGSFVNFTFSNDFDYIHQPVAISEFPKDIWSTPLSWARRYGNVVQKRVHDKGGHFAAFEVPDLLLADIREFWGNGSLSGVDVFKQSKRA
ncbi:MAG: hypothetical protein MMC23_002470 [Stictis urceolatum]|nr:hypothetical protein [Stictis urceolata]